MAIYNLFEDEKLEMPAHNRVEMDEPTHKKDRIFSCIAARLFFLLLLIGDVSWLIYNVARLLLLLPFLMITCGKWTALSRLTGRVFLGIRRGLTCCIALFVSLFSPALGIMFACTYFLMYDRAGIDEVVPASLRPQFYEFMHLNE